MAGKMREKARDIRKSLFRFFCFCSAATPTADDGEVPRQPDGRLRFVVRSDLDQSIDMPAQSEMSNGKVLGLTRDFSCLFERREPRQQNVERKAALTSIILEQATPSVFVPRQHAPHHPSLNVDRKIEIASILEQVAGGPPSASIQEVLSMSEFIEQRLSFTRSDIPVFNPSQPAAAISVTHHQVSPVPRQQAPPATSMPRQQAPPAIYMPCQQAPPAISMPRQQAPPATSMPHQSQQATPSVSPPRQQASSSVSVPRQQPPSVSVLRHPSQDGDRKTEIASILKQMVGSVPSDSIEEVREMYEFIERALSFTRSDLPVFQPSQTATAPRPLFAPRAAGAIFTPGAVFEPRARFGQGAVVPSRV